MTMSAIPREFPRTFVPETCDFGDWGQIEPILESLQERPIAAAGELEQWLLDHSELAACLSEERANRYIRMTCHTDDPEIEKAYLHFIETIQPQTMPYWDALNRTFYDSPFRNQLDPERYQVLIRHLEVEIEIFRDANIPFFTECNKLSQQYQKGCGEMTVQFDGKEHTLPQMAKYLEETDRTRRQDAWELTWRRRQQNREAFEGLFDRLVTLRHGIAQNTDFETFREYAFKMYKRFDYTPDDCLRFHRAVQHCVVPLAREIAEQRRKKLGVESLRPWDLNVDPQGRPPLQPFQSADEFCRGIHQLFSQLDPELAAEFIAMQERSELDLDSRKGKAPGGYLYCRDESRRPFIFMNATGLQRDVETLLHESGHAFHSLASRREPLIEYREAPIEFAEVASMSMELFGDDLLEVFYSPEEAARAKRVHLEGIIDILPWIARIDDFQHWIYTHPTHSHEERTAYWLELEERYGLPLDWSGYEDIREFNWQRQLHLFCHAFYYIEYGIAQLGALQLWCRFKQDPLTTLQRYREGLALGGSKPLPVLFETAGAHFDFSESTIQPLMEQVEKELQA